MPLSVYKKTARKSSKKSGRTYAFGRKKELDGLPVDQGGYCLWVVDARYDGKVRGGIRKSLCIVERNLTFTDAVDLMNKKLGRKEFQK